MVKKFWAVVVIFMIMAMATLASAAQPNKGNPVNPPTNVAKTYAGTTETTGTPTSGTAAVTSSSTAASTTSIFPQIAWVRYGPISLEPYRNNDWFVSYGGSLGGTPVLAVSLSIPWTNNGIGHRYSINTESNYIYNTGAWVQVSSGDDFGIPSGTYINLIGIY